MDPLKPILKGKMPRIFPKNIIGRKINEPERFVFGDVGTGITFPIFEINVSRSKITWIIIKLKYVKIFIQL